MKVRYLDVLDCFGTFQFQYIWYVYICGFLSWPFFWVPKNPPSTWLGFPCCPGKPQKLRHPCNRTWEPWHFTSKTKRWIQDGFFHYKNGRAGISTILKKVTMKVVYKEDRWSEERSSKQQEGGWFFFGVAILMTLVIWAFFSQIWSLPCSCFCVFNSEPGTRNSP